MSKEIKTCLTGDRNAEEAAAATTSADSLDYGPGIGGSWMANTLAREFQQQEDGKSAIALADKFTHYPIKTLEVFLVYLINVITCRIKRFHKDFSLPLTGVFWEETLHRSFNDIGLNTTWQPNRSHAVGEDMRLESIENSRISCKSGQFVNDRSLGKPCVKFNGSRSTSYHTLEEKLAHFCEPHDDIYILLAKSKSPKGETFNKKYKLLVFESHICRVDQLTWTESSSGKSWNGMGNFKACIGKSMSGQLWTTLPLDMITYQYDIDCSDE